MRIEREPFRPSPSDVEAISRVAGKVEPDAADLGEWLRAYVANHRDRIAHDLSLVRGNVPEGASVLEIGSVPPLLTGALREAGYAVKGVDLAPGRFSAAIERLGIEVTQCDVEREPLPVESGFFDAALFNEIFEHLRIDPIYTMREVLRVLRPGGALLLSTPNLRSLGGIRNFLLRGRAHSCSGDVFEEYDKLDKLGHMGHVREYTPREVSDFLGKIGFEVEKIVFRGTHRSLLSRVAIRLFPSLRPFMTLVARKPAARSAG